MPCDVFIESVFRQEDEIVDILRRDFGKQFRDDAPIIRGEDGAIHVVYVDHIIWRGPLSAAVRLDILTSDWLNTNTRGLCGCMVPCHSGINCGRWTAGG